MWFRIELHKDGSVASCEEASGSFNEGKSVHYVEASTKEEAINALLGRRKHRLHLRRKANAAKYRELRAKGLCYSCGADAAGASQCPLCSEKNRERCKRRASLPKPSLSLEDVAAKELRIREKKRQLDREAMIRKVSRFGSNNRYQKWLILIRVADRFDSYGPDAFRIWLKEEIASLDAAGEPAAKAAE